MADRADLVVIGAGTIGGWASVFATGGRARPGGRRRARAGRDGRLVARGGDRPGPGRDAGDGGPGPLDDRLLQRPAGRLRHRFGVPRARLPDPRGHRGGRARRARARRDAARERPRRRLARRGRRPRRRPSRSPPMATAAAATSRPTGRSTRPGTCAPTRWRCRRPASSCASGRRSPACAPRRRPAVASRVTAVETDRGTIETDRVLLTGGPSLRDVGRRGRPANPGRCRPPHGRGPRAAPGVRRPADADGLRHRRRALLAARGGRPAVRLERSGRTARRGPLDRLGALRPGARTARRVRAGDPRPRPAPDLGRDHRLHARITCRSSGRRSTADGRARSRA